MAAYVIFDYIKIGCVAVVNKQFKQMKNASAYLKYVIGAMKCVRNIAHFLKARNVSREREKILSAVLKEFFDINHWLYLFNINL